ncbi:hypothetical protein OESDEN_21127, partial [Oesophagostomum dentatum]
MFETLTNSKIQEQGESNLRNVFFSERAVNCDDRYSEASCMFIYTTAVREGSIIDRSIRCFRVRYPNAIRVNDNLVAIAIKTCPRTCGYCCLTPEYNCKNKASKFPNFSGAKQGNNFAISDPRINCAKVTKWMCKSQLWRNILIDDCPNICGFCMA